MVTEGSTWIERSSLSPFVRNSTSSTSSRVAKKLLEYAQEIYIELLCARREDRALDESFAWSLLTLSEFISGFGDVEMRDIDAEIATWGREK